MVKLNSQVVCKWSPQLLCGLDMCCVQISVEPCSSTIVTVLATSMTGHCSIGNLYVIALFHESLLWPALLIILCITVYEVDHKKLILSLQGN